MYALVMSIRPDLTWRDFQYITVASAIPIQTSDTDWTRVANNRMFNHKYGFGKLDATRLIDVAANWTVVNPQSMFSSGFKNVNAAIPETVQGLIINYTVYSQNMTHARIKRLEHISVTTSISVNRRGRLQIYITSPSGYVSVLAPIRKNDGDKDGLNNWTFSSVKHWGEDPIGVWKLWISLDRDGGGEALLKSYRIVMFGEQVSFDGKATIPTVIVFDNGSRVAVATGIIMFLIVLIIGLWKRKNKYSEFHELNDLEVPERFETSIDDDVIDPHFSNAKQRDLETGSLDSSISNFNTTLLSKSVKRKKEDATLFIDTKFDKPIIKNKFEDSGDHERVERLDVKSSRPFDSTERTAYSLATPHSTKSSLKSTESSSSPTKSPTKKLSNVRFFEGNP